MKLDPIAQFIAAHTLLNLWEAEPRDEDGDEIRENCPFHFYETYEETAEACIEVGTLIEKTACTLVIDWDNVPFWWRLWLAEGANLRFIYEACAEYPEDKSAVRNAIEKTLRAVIPAHNLK